MSASRSTPGPDDREGDLERLEAVYAERDRRLAGGERYAPSRPGQRFIAEGRRRALGELLGREGLARLAQARILELGCGQGGILQEYLALGADPRRLHGAELLAERIRTARARLPELPLVCADGRRLPYAGGCFDLVLQYTVFSSVLDERIRAQLAGEMRRVLRPDGLVVWYDFWWNPLNRDTRGLRPAAIRRLFPGCTFQFRRVTLAPPLARRLAPVSWRLARLLESSGLLNSHYLAAIRPGD